MFLIPLSFFWGKRHFWKFENFWVWNIRNRSLFPAMQESMFIQKSGRTEEFDFFETNFSWILTLNLVSNQIFSLNRYFVGLLPHWIALSTFLFHWSCAKLHKIDICVIVYYIKYILFAFQVEQSVFSNTISEKIRKPFDLNLPRDAKKCQFWRSTVYIFERHILGSGN